jgi:hypothetical protein
MQGYSQPLALFYYQSEMEGHYQITFCHMTADEEAAER